MEIAEKFDSNNIWFDFSIMNEVCVSTNKQRKDYCSYNSQDGIMIYKYKTIDDVTKIRVVDLFMKYLKYILDKKDIFAEVCGRF